MEEIAEQEIPRCKSIHGGFRTVLAGGNNEQCPEVFSGGGPDPPRNPRPMVSYPSERWRGGREAEGGGLLIHPALFVLTAFHLF